MASTPTRQDRASSSASHRSSDHSSTSNRGKLRSRERPRPTIDTRSSQSPTAAVDTVPGVDPHLVAEITKQVLANLKATGIDTADPLQRHTTPPRPLTPPLEHTDTSKPKSSPISPVSPYRYRGRYNPPSCDSELSSPEPISSDSAYNSCNELRTDPPFRSSRSLSAEAGERAAQADIPRASQPTEPLGSADTTLLEKIWQPLFDNENRPTARLGQLLRGIAKYLVDDFEPKDSLVIAPPKLAAFFEQTKLANDIYPWKSIFGGKVSNSSISKLYRDLRCQHHLCQGKAQDMPTIPALTPVGLETFLTILIQAHPEHEFRRLSIVLRDMPINNADDVKERLPKQLVRCLLPSHPVLQKQQHLAAALSSADSAIQLDNYHMPPPPPLTTRTNRDHNAKPREEPAPHEGVQIERDRRPYSAREGTGKIHDESGKATGISGVSSKADCYTANFNAFEHATRPSRSNSATPVHEREPIPRSRPADISQRRAHRMSMYGACSGIPARYGTSPNHASLNYTHEQAAYSNMNAGGPSTARPAASIPAHGTDLPGVPTMDFPRRPLRRTMEDTSARNSHNATNRPTMHDAYVNATTSTSPSGTTTMPNISFSARDAGVGSGAGSSYIPSNHAGMPSMTGQVPSQSSTRH